MNERDFDEELIEAIDNVIEWLDYDIWADCLGLEEAVKQLRNKRIAKLAQTRRTGDANG